MDNTIGVCGFSGTGSSAVIDYLKGFDEVGVLDPFEFALPYLPDGLLDLRYHLHEGGMRDFQCRVALKRFSELCHGFESRVYQKHTNGRFHDMTDRYIADLVQIELAGRYRNSKGLRCLTDRAFRKLHVYKLISEIEKKRGHELCVYPLQKVAISIYPENFMERTRQYIDEILDAMGREKGKNVVLNQPFSANDPAAAFPFFMNPRAIIVDRDPRDLYLFMKDFWRPYGFRAIPADNPRDFCLFYRKLRENMPYKNGNPDILCIRFEDMIYRHQDTAAKVRKFCGIENAQEKRKIFVPEESVNNTQVFKRYPQFRDDVKYIENELSEYIYPFEQFGDVDTSGKFFDHPSELRR